VADWRTRGISPPALDNGGVVQTGGGDAEDMWGEVTDVAAEVRSGEHEIGRVGGSHPPKPDVECVALDNGGDWFKLVEAMLGTCGVR
jgi:hypothetical protein